MAHKLKDRVLVLDEMDAKRAEIAVVQAPVDWNGQAKQTLNPKPKLLPGQSSPEPSKSVSFPRSHVTNIEKETMGQRWQCKAEQLDRQSGCSNTGSCAKTQGAAGGSHR